MTVAGDLSFCLAAAQADSQTAAGSQKAKVTHVDVFSSDMPRVIATYKLRDVLCCLAGDWVRLAACTCSWLHLVHQRRGSAWLGRKAGKIVRQAHKGAAVALRQQHHQQHGRRPVHVLAPQGFPGPYPSIVIALIMCCEQAASAEAMWCRACELLGPRLVATCFTPDKELQKWGDGGASDRFEVDLRPPDDEVDEAGHGLPGLPPPRARLQAGCKPTPRGREGQARSSSDRGSSGGG